MQPIIVNKCQLSINEFANLTSLHIDNYWLNDDDLHKRRLNIMRLIAKEKGRGDLESLQNLQQLQNLQILNLSYEQVKIETPINETIIYCDPPYKGIGKYQKDIDHDKFLEWVKNSPYKIYISSYDFDLPCVFELSHRSSLSATNNGKKVVEKLFCNQEEKTKGTLF